jgi:hypothetical protein
MGFAALNYPPCLLFPDVAVGGELFEVGPQVAGLLLILDAGEDLLGAPGPSQRDP